MTQDEELAFKLLQELCEAHLTCSLKLRDGFSRALSQRDMALIEARAQRVRADTAFDCHGGPGTTIAPCEACVSCLMRRVDRISLARDEATQELRGIRALIQADPNISVLDELQSCMARWVLAEERANSYEAAKNGLESDVAEERELRDKLAHILRRTAIALKGPEPELTSWSWHDLPEVAAALKAERDAAQNDFTELLPAVAAMRAHVDATRAEAFRVVTAAGQTHAKLINEHHRFGEVIDKLLEHASAHDCEGAECSRCGEIVCPHGDSMHFHHDGCPSCANDEEHEEELQGNAEILQTDDDEQHGGGTPGEAIPPSGSVGSERPEVADDGEDQNNPIKDRE